MAKTAGGRAARTAWIILGVAALTRVATAAAADCAKLAALELPHAKVTGAELVAAGAFTLPPGGPPAPPGVPPPSFADLPAFCRVTAVSTPTSDSEIRFEVWMPQEGWNGKFLGTGNGGWWGAILHLPLAEGLRRGYAAANTDTGHTSGVMDASWALGHPEKIVDFGYRGVHEMTVQAKSIVAAFYGKPPSRAYWNGCSSGGKQGLKEAQRFPEDYEGIVAGAPANYWTHLTAATVWFGLLPLRSPAHAIPHAKFALIHKAAIAACDSRDGLVDGLIDDPTACHFDPAVLQCKGEDGPDCLTEAQADTARRAYGPATTPKGVAFFPGLEPGSELVWGFLLGGPEPSRIGSDYWTYVVHQDPKWNPRTLDFDAELPRADAADVGTINAIDPDLGRFKARGGKLVLYHGWADALIPPGNTLDYHASVEKAMGGPAATRDFLRLFMVPGVGHCGGGEGPDHFDAIGALEQWVEQGKAPDMIVASHATAGKTDRTRPLCVYPSVARYKGAGSIDDAGSFSCGAPNAAR